MVSPKNLQNIDAVAQEIESITKRTDLWTDSIYQLFALESKANSKQVSIALTANFPRIKEWVGEREVETFEAYVQSFVAKNYQRAVGVDRADVLGDNHEEVANAIAAFNAALAQDKLDLLTTILLAGNSTLGIDGLNFYGTTHVEGSNLVSSAFSRATWEAMQDLARQMTDQSGRPLNVNLDSVMGGYEYIHVAKDIFDSVSRLQLVTAAGAVDPSASGVAAAAIDNRNIGGTYYYNPFMNGSNKVVAWDSTKPSKPMFIKTLLDLAPRNTLGQDGVPMTSEELFVVDGVMSMGLFDHRVTVMADGS